MATAGAVQAKTESKQQTFKIAEFDRAAAGNYCFENAFRAGHPALPRVWVGRSIGPLSGRQVPFQRTKHDRRSMYHQIAIWLIGFHSHSIVPGGLLVTS